MGPESGGRRLWSQIGGMERVWEGSNPKRLKTGEGTYSHGDRNGSKIGKNFTDGYVGLEMVQKHAEKEVLLLGRDFKLRESAASGSSIETERRMLRGRRKGGGKTEKEKEEDRNASLQLSAWIAKKHPL